MKTLSIIFLLALFTLGYCQFKTDTMQVNVTINAPQNIINQIHELAYVIELRPHGSVMQIYKGMPFDEVLALGLAQISTQTPLVTNIDYPLPANGDDYQVGVWALDANRKDLILIDGIDHYIFGAGVSGIGQVPMIQDTVMHYIYPQVKVNFKE